MRKTMIALVLVLVPGLVFAQETERRAERMGAQGGFAGMLLEQRETLDLTSDQVTRLEALAAEHTAKRAAMRASMQAHRASGERPATMSEEQRQAMRARMDSVRTAMNTSRDAARAILTAEQQEKLDAIMSEHRAQRRPGMRAHPGMHGRRGERGPRPPRDASPPEPPAPTPPPLDRH